MNKPKQAETLIIAQEIAVRAILDAPTQGKRAASFGCTVLNRKVRRVAAIRKNFERNAAALGYQAAQIPQMWEDVKDIAKLHANAA